MKVILTKDQDNLGKAGALVEVKRGYGRNYLLPRGMAVVATEKNVRQLEHDKAGIIARAAKHRSSMTAQAQKLSAVEVKLSRKVGEQDKLFGSVTALDIAEALAAAGHKLDRRLIHLPEPIRAVGQFEIEIRLHREVAAKIKVEVVGEAA